jgi:ATP-binding protein involved in chromosome partitioning
MSGSVTTANLQAAIADFKDPETGRPAAGMNQIRDLQVDGSTATLTLALTTHSAPIAEETRQRLADYIRGRLPALTTVNIQSAVHERPAPPIGQIGLTAKSVVAVGSAKGGVGKSTIAATLALGLAKTGSKVGLMDADVYGPSIPHLLGLSGRATIKDNKIEPFLVGDMPVMSMGFFVNPGEAVVFRGPKLHGAIVQFLRDTAWGNLDYLIIDMPPGTGDVALTLSQ